MSKFMRGLRVERLEDRHMMAVGVSSSNGTVKINGNGADDEVTVTQTDTNTFEVAFINKNGNQVLRTFNNVRKFDVDLKGGVDNFSMVGTDQRGRLQELEIHTGSGQDFIAINAVQLLRDLEIDTGDGADTVTIGGGRVRGETEIELGGARGVDPQTQEPLFNSLEIDETRFDDDVHVEGGDDWDDITFDACDLRRELSVESRDGDDNVRIIAGINFGKVQIDTEDGEDFVTFQSAVFRDEVDADLGEGSDDVAVLATAFRIDDGEEDVEFDGGDGSDSVAGQFGLADEEQVEDFEEVGFIV